MYFSISYISRSPQPQPWSSLSLWSAFLPRQNLSITVLELKVAASGLFIWPLLVWTNHMRELGRGWLRPATPEIELPPYTWWMDEVRATWSSWHCLPGIEVGLVEREGWQMLAACPSWEEITAPDWELGRKRAPFSLATPAQIRAYQIDFHNMGVSDDRAGSVWNTTDSLCSYQDLVDFLEWILLHLLYNLRTISRDFKWLLFIIFTS